MHSTRVIYLLRTRTKKRFPFLHFCSPYWHTVQYTQYAYNVMQVKQLVEQTLLMAEALAESHTLQPGCSKTKAGLCAPWLVHVWWGNQIMTFAFNIGVSIVPRMLPGSCSSKGLFQTMHVLDRYLSTLLKVGGRKEIWLFLESTGGMDPTVYMFLLRVWPVMKGMCGNCECF